MEYWKILRKHLGKQRVIMPSSLGVITKNNKILLTLHKELKSWGFPGGLQDLNESVEETAKREIKEELNLKLEVNHLIGIYSSDQWHHSFPNGDEIQNLSFLFMMSSPKKFDKIQLQPEEIEAYDFFELDNLPKNCSALTLQQFNDLKSFKGKVFMR